MHNWGIKPAVSQPQQLQSTAGCYQEGTGGWIRLSSRRVCRAAAGQNPASPLRASTRRGDESFLRSAYEKTAFDHEQYLGDQLRC